MTKVLVIELPDQADLAEALRAIEAALGSLAGAKAFGAIREDAERVLAVFKESSPSVPAGRTGRGCGGGSVPSGNA